MSNILECKSLTKIYSQKAALDNVTMTIPGGRIIGLLGPNGSGKTTLIKLIAGLLVPTSGEIYIDGYKPGAESKAVVSYLPERPYFQSGMKVSQMIDYFADFYADFDYDRAERMLAMLNIDPKVRFGSLSKGNKEKVQLVLVMSRQAKLYLLDEPIGGVDPAARDYILNTIVNNYNPEATVLISTHLIADVEPILDGFIFLHQGRIVRIGSVDAAREAEQKSLDELFREVFKCLPNY